MNMHMKSEFSNKWAHDLCTHPNRLRDFRGSFDKIKKATSLGIKVLTLSFVRAIDFSNSSNMMLCSKEEWLLVGLAEYQCKAIV